MNALDIALQIIYSTVQDHLHIHGNLHGTRPGQSCYGMVLLYYNVFMILDIRWPQNIWEPSIKHQRAIAVLCTYIACAYIREHTGVHCIVVPYWKVNCKYYWKLISGLFPMFYCTVVKYRLIDSMQCYSMNNN
jgi:hypothetical protein